ncbi:MAG: SOS response-associated peptidase [Bacteroidia bacterium]|nr:SOS response-associated peptidase [Bacteroidia bacterium]
MCFHSKQTKKAIELEHRFRAKFEQDSLFTPSIFNGFQFPKTPVIANDNSNTIKLFNWGLIPSWAKDKEIRKNTLNARIETIAEKPSFRSYVKQRCLVLVDGFYEWQWLDEKGKQKQKYEIGLPDDSAFALAGIWSEWLDKETGELMHTYSILTTEANEFMARIHNSKKRMPVIIHPNNEQAWLNGGELSTEPITLKAVEV